MAEHQEAEASSSRTTSASSAEGGNAEGTKKNDDPGDEERAFECNICLDTAKDAVISMCGHLFCWPCIHAWLETRPNRQSCPVCKAAISRDKVIPLYGRGSSRQDPREKLPPRPTPQRTEAPENSGVFGGNLGIDGFQMSFGIGAFPFGLFASTFNFGDPVIRGHGAHGTNPANEDERFLSQLFLWVAILFIFYILII